jgi:hypothetical protein
MGRDEAPASRLGRPNVKRIDRGQTRPGPISVVAAEIHRGMADWHLRQPTSAIIQDVCQPSVKLKSTLNQLVAYFAMH